MTTRDEYKPTATDTKRKWPYGFRAARDKFITGTGDMDESISDMETRIDDILTQMEAIRGANKTNNRTGIEVSLAGAERMVSDLRAELRALQTQAVRLKFDMQALPVEDTK
jgi:hypothetical protein